MRNKLLISALALLLLPLTAQAQEEEWQEVEAPVHLEFDSQLYSGGIVHGVTVDNNGYVWINTFTGNDPAGMPVVDMEGNHASFSPIASVTVDGTEYSTEAGGRGITKDADGDIMAVFNSTQLLHIDAETGEGLGVWEGPGSLTGPAVDEFGFVYVGQVLETPPIFVIDSETWLDAFSIPPSDEITYLSRSTAVSDDGSTVISATISGPRGLYFYTSEDLSNYELTDTAIVFDGDASSVQFDPEGMLWGTDEGTDPQDPELGDPSLKVFDLENRTYYSLRHDSLDLQPRGVGFAFEGDTKQIVVGSFFTGSTEIFNVVEGPVAVEDPEQPEAFTLEQNFPNPFNPTTTIRYKLQQAGDVTLRVYNSTGQLVNTLVSGQQASGQHEARWNGTDANGRTVSSGVYFYSLETANHRETRAMTFLK